MRRIGSVAGVAAVLVLGLASSASAGTLDQQQTAFDYDAGIGSTQSIAQTFTPGISGKLDRIDLLLDHLASPTASVNVQIRDASSAGPGSTVLASNSIPAASIGTAAAFVPVTFASPASVTAGMQYAIVAYSADPSNDYGWGVKVANAYPGGTGFDAPDSPPNASTAWNMDSGDQAFKTYVVTPTPGPTATLKKCKKHKKKHSASSAKKHCKKKKKH
jgi:hypothetical protein